VKRKWLALESPAGDVQHLLTCVDAGHLCGGIALQQRGEELPGTFANEQNASQGRDIIPESIAAILELTTGEERLHPIVIPGEMIESRDRRRLQRGGDQLTKTSAVPPHTRDDGAKRVGSDIDKVTDYPWEKEGPDQFGDERPDRQMPQNFGSGWWAVVTSKSPPALHAENDRQCGRDKKHVVKVLVEERPRTGGRDQPAIESIQSAGKETERVERVAESPHRRAVITKPAPIAKSPFRQNIIIPKT
jgi:hypothetical protein